MSCPLCRRRKGKRLCPAKGEKICAHCCGTRRRVEIQCPDDCVYLTGEHAGSWEGRETERQRDMRRVAGPLQGLNENQARLFLFLLVGLTGIRRRLEQLDDHLLGQGLTALRKTVETRLKGVLFEHQAEDVRAQAVVHELTALLASKDEEGRPIQVPDADLLAVLQGLESALAATEREQAGPTTFLDTTARLANRLGASRPDRPRPLIVEP